jgi:hypothetical protein
MHQLGMTLRHRLCKCRVNGNGDILQGLQDMLHAPSTLTAYMMQTGPNTDRFKLAAACPPPSLQPPLNIVCTVRCLSTPEGLIMDSHCSKKRLRSTPAQQRAGGRAWGLARYVVSLELICALPAAAQVAWIPLWPHPPKTLHGWLPATNPLC